MVPFGEVVAPKFPKCRGDGKPSPFARPKSLTSKAKPLPFVGMSCALDKARVLESEMETLSCESAIEDDKTIGAANLADRGTILLVEDESFVRTVTSEVLRMQGYRVLEAASAA